MNEQKPVTVRDSLEVMAGGDPPHPLRALIIDDDLSIQNMLADYFKQHNILAVSAFGREEALRQFEAEEPDIVILDLLLAHEDGLDLLRDIRVHSNVPILITSGSRRDEIDRVVGLELGADDYITKPFGLRELVARVRAIMRRRDTERPSSSGDAERGRYRFGDWTLDRRLRRLTNSKDELVNLTKGEYALLVTFLGAPQRVLSREYLLQATRIHGGVFDRSIDVQILRLRRKLEIDPSSPRIIQTERGLGYKFALPVERS